MGNFRGGTDHGTRHKRIQRDFRGIITQIVDLAAKAEVMKTFGGGAAQKAFTVNSMVMGLLFARLDTQTLNGIRDAMYSGASADLKAILDRIDD